MRLDCPGEYLRKTTLAQRSPLDFPPGSGFSPKKVVKHEQRLAKSDFAWAVSVLWQRSMTFESTVFAVYVVISFSGKNSFSVAVPSLS